MSGEQRPVEELADEFVLGLLDPSEQAAVEARMENDPAMRAAVGVARDRFVELDMAGEAAPAPAAIWAGIETRLADTAAPQVAQARPMPAANDNRLRRWRATAFAAMAAALLLAVALGWNLGTGREPRVIAILLDDAGEALAMVEDFGDETARVIPLVEFAVPEDRVMQVWTLPSTEMGPVSLGLLPSSTTMTLDGPALPAPHPGQLYEITLEPAGGSPTGRPTGPILVKGLAKTPR